MPISELLLTYRYWFVGLGVVFADLPTLLFSGYLVGSNYLQLWPTLIIAIFVRSTVDLVLFTLGRRKNQLGNKIPFLLNLKKKISNFVIKNDNLIILTYHFIQGFKLSTPIAFGISKTKLKKFFILNFFAVSFWASCLIALGIFIQLITNSS